MCIGAFEGIVKKVVKRGRPRKNRPDAEERHDKASQTQSKNKAMSSASSTSSYLEISYGLSPPVDFDILDDKPSRDFTNDFSQNARYPENDGFPYPSAQSPTPNYYVSLQAIQNAPSPSSFSTHFYHSHYSYHIHRGSIDETVNQHLPPLPPSPTKSVTSHYNTPPELCLSSSSPVPSHQVYDFPESSETGDLEFSKLAALQNIHIPEHNDEMFLDTFSNAGDMSTTRLEQDLSLLLMGGKFDDTFGDWDNWT
jgi:regulatory protein SWI5